MDKRAIVGAFLIAWAAALQVCISISCKSCIFVTFYGFCFGGPSSQMAEGGKVSLYKILQTFVNPKSSFICFEVVV
jgi:hypothetical protein